MNLLKSQQVAETVDSVYTDLETILMKNIVRHIKGYEQPIASDKWQLQKLAEIGKLNKENIFAISKSAGISQTSAERMLQSMADEVLSELEPGYRYLARQGLVAGAVPAVKSKNVKQVVDNLKKQCKDTLNLCNTTMLYKAREAYKDLIQNVTKTADEIANKQDFLNALNQNVSAAVTGSESRQQAVRKCIQKFNEKGIPAFVDKRGRNWTPEAYVNMSMRATCGSVTNEVQMARCKDHGVNLFSLDSHSGARPKCAKDQGKIFDLENRSGTTEDLKGKKIKYYPWKSSSYGEPDGILGINCGHHGFPFIPGVNIHRYFPTEDLDANNKRYKETQVQRALEREVRKQKRECMLFDELDDTDAFDQSSVKLKRAEGKLKQYVDSKENLNRRKDREQVVGFDKRVSAEAMVANKKVQKDLAKRARDDKIKLEIKEAGIKGQVDLKPQKIDVSGFDFDEKHINKDRQHNISREDAERFIEDADVKITKWNGRFENYYGKNGAVFVDVENNNIRTAFGKGEFDNQVKKLREVIDKYE